MPVTTIALPDCSCALQSARAAVLAHMDTLRSAMIIERSSEVVEQAALLSGRDAAAREMNWARVRLSQIDAALDRLRHGEYGRCLVCDEAIGAKRLTAVPEAECCIGCEMEAAR